MANSSNGLVEFSITAFSLIGTVIGNMFMSYNKEFKERRTLAASLLAEILAVEAIYRRVELQPWKGMNTEFNLVNINEDYFSVYHNNNDKIGIFDMADSQVIVECYTYFTAYHETLRLLAKRHQDHISAYQQYMRTSQDRMKMFANPDNFFGAGDVEGLYLIAYAEQPVFYNNLNKLKPIYQAYLNETLTGRVRKAIIGKTYNKIMGARWVQRWARNGTLWP